MWNLSAPSFTNDELSALTRTEFDDFPTLIEKGVREDVHPAGVQVFLYYWASLTGMAEGWIRLPFALAGIFSVVFLFLSVRMLFGEPAAIFAGACLGLLVFPLTHSQLARPYSPGLLFVLIVAWAWIRVVVKNQEKLWLFAVMALAAAAAFYTHYFAAFSAALTGFSGIFLLRGSVLRKYLLAWVSACILFLPHTGITLHHLGIGGIGGEEGWLGPPQPAFFQDFLFQAANRSTWAIGTIALVWLLAQPWKSRHAWKWRFLFLAWAIIPGLTGYGYSLYVNPLLHERALLFSFPFLLVFLASFIPRESRMTSMAFPLLLFVLLASTLVERRYYAVQKQGGSFREVAAHLADWTGQEAYRKSLVLADVHDLRYLGIYLDRFGAAVPMVNIHNRQPWEVDSLLKTTPASSVIECWSIGFHPPEVAGVIRSRYPNREMVRHYEDGGIALYSASGEDLTGITWRYAFGFESVGYDTWVVDENHITHVDFHSDHFSYAFKPGEEYGPAFVLPLHGDIQAGDVVYINAFTKVPERAEVYLSLAWLRKGQETIIKIMPANRFPADSTGWRKVHLALDLPEKPSSGDTLKVYIWNPGKTFLWVDDMEVWAERPPEVQAP